MTQPWKRATVPRRGGGLGGGGWGLGVGGGWGVGRGGWGVGPFPKPQSPIPNPLLDASIPIANPTRLFPARTSGSPVALSHLASVKAGSQAAGRRNTASASRASGGSPFASARSSPAASSPRP